MATEAHPIAMVTCKNLPEIGLQNYNQKLQQIINQHVHSFINNDCIKQVVKTRISNKLAPVLTLKLVHPKTDETIKQLTINFELEQLQVLTKVKIIPC